MKILGFEIKKVEKPIVAPKECQHLNAECVNLEDDIYQCPDCGKGCHYVNGKLTPITFENMNDSDEGGEIDGIIQF